ncbi:conserved hypothetical protein [Crenothrix polyspora]|uniref:Peptidase M41 domain-containing protein n=1 Tax=Crenothrix polyspora TaxID=360316 RepID=A0A1R4H8V0_9GAMM|nr:hypothetical protein [Crenothrix polyspora]SJM92684.1 conserved hypothetical protein [Crenothrix polyspora]
MNRHHSTSNLKQLPNGDLSQETAIHEAGHATAIYLGNKQRQLPPVFFQIFIKRKSPSHCTSLSNEGRTHPEWIAKVEGGGCD